MTECDCGALNGDPNSKWFGVHEKGCASLRCSGLISRSALLAILRKEREAYFHRFFVQDPATGTWEARTPYEEELEQMDARIEFIENFPAVDPIAKLIDNNQVGWKNIIETAPGVTIDVGTHLYVEAPLSTAE